MTSILAIKNLTKTYQGGFEALKDVNLTIKKGEIFALLGPNGAGKTTLISTICGLVHPTSGSIQAGGYDILGQYRAARSLIGLVPQELTTDAFETVWNTVNFSRGLFGKPPAPDYLEKLLRSLSLWEKRRNQLRTLSGGMKRRVLIAKALAHEPEILFLDEPTAGVDVELRKNMWDIVRELQQKGVTIILTTHYIEEAEEMADRIGIIRRGEIILVEDKQTLMRKLGQKQLILQPVSPIKTLPATLEHLDLSVTADGEKIIYTYDTQLENTGITELLAALNDAGICFKDLHTQQSSLEDIFVGLVREETK